MNNTLGPFLVAKRLLSPFVQMSIPLLSSDVLPQFRLARWYETIICSFDFWATKFNSFELWIPGISTFICLSGRCLRIEFVSSTIYSFRFIARPARYTNRAGESVLALKDRSNTKRHFVQVPWLDYSGAVAFGVAGGGTLARS